MPPAPPVPDSGVKPSGGIPATLHARGRTRKEISEERKRYGIQDALAAEIIEAVAAHQVDRLETDEQKRFEELHRELELRHIMWQGRYLEALNGIRTRLIDEEIAARLRMKFREEEEIMMLLMMAAAVA